MRKIKQLTHIIKILFNPKHKLDCIRIVTEEFDNYEKSIIYRYRSGKFDTSDSSFNEDDYTVIKEYFKI